MLLAQYSFLHKDSNTNAGGVALYAKRKIEFSVKDKIHFNTNGCKDLWNENLTKSWQKNYCGSDI